MTEPEKAKAWRERLGLSVKQLAALSGYSVVTIHWMERGLTPPRTRNHMAGSNKGERNIAWYVWQRYKLVCGAVGQQVKSGKIFEWGTE